jgi:hypothetical protein
MTGRAECRHPRCGNENKEPPQRLGNEGEVTKAGLKAGRSKYAQIGKCIYKKGSETRQQDRNGMEGAQGG